MPVSTWPLCVSRRRVAAPPPPRIRRAGPRKIGNPSETHGAPATSSRVAVANLHDPADLLISSPSLHSLYVRGIILGYKR